MGLIATELYQRKIVKRLQCNWVWQTQRPQKRENLTGLHTATFLEGNYGSTMMVVPDQNAIQIAKFAFAKKVR